MAVLDSGLDRAWIPEQYGLLIDTVLEDLSIAFRAASVVRTDKEQIRFPMLTADPSVAWLPENTQISPSDPTLDELVVVPKAVKALTQVSNETVSDTTPQVAEQIGRALARSVGKKVDAAWFGNTVSNGPSGLLSVSSTAVDTAGAITAVADLDLFHDAKKVALDHNAKLTHFVISQAVATQLAKVKTADTYNTSLLPDVSDGTVIAGLPVLVSPLVDANTLFWGIDTDQVFTVQRTGTSVAVSTDSAFDYDATQVRVTARVGFGFANPAGIIRAYDVTP